MPLSYYLVQFNLSYGLPAFFTYIACTSFITMLLSFPLSIYVNQNIRYIDIFYLFLLEIFYPLNTLVFFYVIYTLFYAFISPVLSTSLLFIIFPLIGYGNWLIHFEKNNKISESTKNWYFIFHFFVSIILAVIVAFARYYTIT
jgi:hypothetical protein